VPKCILIVDDHEDIRKLVRNFLEAESEFRVCGEAIDGYDAIEKAQALKPDLIILDLSMPRMDGIQAARRLKKIVPQIPIVLFTSYSDAIERHDALLLGIKAVVAKGSDLSLLANSVQSLLQEA
jgi:two-component system, NarL family, vancomycin resistance associated response regulator VraR